MPSKGNADKGISQISNGITVGMMYLRYGRIVLLLFLSWLAMTLGISSHIQSSFYQSDFYEQLCGCEIETYLFDNSE